LADRDNKGQKAFTVAITQKGKQWPGSMEWRAFGQYGHEKNWKERKPLMLLLKDRTRKLWHRLPKLWDVRYNNAR